MAIDEEEEASWKRVGISARDAESYRRLGFTPEAAKLWFDASIFPYQARGYGDAGLTPEEALAWRNAKVSGPDAAGFARAGFNLNDAVRLLAQGVVGRDAARVASGEAAVEDIDVLARLRQVSMHATLQDAKAYRRQRIPPSAVEPWAAAGGSPESLADYRASGFSLREAMRWNVLRFSASEAAEWKAAGLDASDADVFRSVREGPAMGASWLDSQFTAVEAAEFIRLKVDLPVARDWAESGVTRCEMLAFARNGVCLEDAETWVRAGRPEPATTMEWTLDPLGSRSGSDAYWASYETTIHPGPNGQIEDVSLYLRVDSDEDGNVAWDVSISEEDAGFGDARLNFGVSPSVGHGKAACEAATRKIQDEGQALVVEANSAGNGRTSMMLRVSDRETLQRAADEMDLPIERWLDCLLSYVLVRARPRPDLQAELDPDTCEAVSLSVDKATYTALVSAAWRARVTPAQLAEGIVKAAYSEDLLYELPMEAIANGLVDLSDLHIEF